MQIYFTLSMNDNDNAITWEDAMGSSWLISEE